MRITYITRSFLDYRIQVFEALDRMVNGRLSMIYAARSMPERVQSRQLVMCSQYNGCWSELVTRENGWVFDPLDQAGTTASPGACLAARYHWPVMGGKSREILGHRSPGNAAKAILNACMIAVGGKNMSGIKDVKKNGAGYLNVTK